MMGCRHETALFHKPGSKFAHGFIIMNKLAKCYQIHLPCQGKNQGTGQIALTVFMHVLWLF